MTSTRIVFAVFVIAVALSTALCHRQPAAKVQDRLTAIDLVAAKLENMRGFCENFYYPWRDQGSGIGIPEIDNMCFAAQVDRP
jgi:hypothetical protein